MVQGEELERSKFLIRQESQATEAPGDSQGQEERQQQKGGPGRCSASRETGTR